MKTILNGSVSRRTLLASGIAAAGMLRCPRSCAPRTSR
jgi:hypothetical protein